MPGQNSITFQGFTFSAGMNKKAAAKQLKDKNTSDVMMFNYLFNKIDALDHNSKGTLSDKDITEFKKISDAELEKWQKIRDKEAENESSGNKVGGFLMVVGSVLFGVGTAIDATVVGTPVGLITQGVGAACTAIGGAL